jgi:small GTP-binding protein
MILKKICLVGDFAVGKTSLVRRFVDRQFDDRYLSTVGVKISRKLLTARELGADSDEEVQLVLWDLAGRTSGRSSPASNLKGAQGAVIVGDLTRPESIASIPVHLEHFLAMSPRALVVVAYNKMDLHQGGEPTPLHHRENILFSMQTSAKTGDGIDHLFHVLGRGLLGGMTA